MTEQVMNAVLNKHKSRVFSFHVYMRKLPKIIYTKIENQNVLDIDLKGNRAFLFLFFFNGSSRFDLHIFADWGYFWSVCNAAVRSQDSVKAKNASVLSKRLGDAPWWPNSTTATS